MPATMKSETAVTILMDTAHAADQALGTAAEIEFPASWLDVLHVAQCEARECEAMPLARFLQHVRNLATEIENSQYELELEEKQEEAEWLEYAERKSGRA